MHFDYRAVHRDRLELDTHYLFSLQMFKYPVEHTILGPAVHACVDRVPSAKSRRESSPLAPMLSNIQDRIEYLQIGNTYIATLYW